MIYCIKYPTVLVHLVRKIQIVKHCQTMALSVIMKIVLVPILPIMMEVLVVRTRFTRSRNK